MSFPRYPAYKDSTVEWLGEVPEHWEIVRLKNLLADRITDGPHTTPTFIDDGIAFLSVDAIQDGEIQFDGCRFVSLEDHEVFRTKALPMRDDILMGKAASTGKIARVKVDFEFSIWSPLALIRVDRSVADPAFVERALTTVFLQAQIDVRCTANTQKNISMDDIPTLVVPKAPLQEQISIGHFLDIETEKIDGLITEQERLLDLLKEKRQAVISHAVTKGLNPDAPMKPSGIDWLGDVPAHWEVSVVKRFSTLQRGYDLSENERTEGSYPVVTSAGVSGTHGVRMAAGPGIVTGRYGSTGRLFFIKEDFWPHNTALFVSDFHGNFPRFVWYSLQTIDFAAYSAKAAVPGIDRNDIHPLPALVPPPDEQIVIADWLDRQMTHLDALSAAALDAIRLLTERRAALISAAVIGQIDVRNTNSPNQPISV